jgi:hypothetical protein
MASMRAFAAFVQARVGTGSATESTPAWRNGSFAMMSTKFGLLLRTASRPALMPRIVSTSSTVPFSQVAMINRCSSAAFATFDTNLTGTALGAASAGGAAAAATAIASGDILMSMNVRRQLFLQKLQRVASLRVVR